MDQNEPATLVGRIHEGTAKLHSFLSGITTLIFSDTLMALGVAVVLFMLNWHIAVIALLPVPLAVLILVTSQKVIRLRLNNSWRKGIVLRQTLGEYVNQGQLFKVTGAELAMKDRLKQAAWQQRTASMRAALVSSGAYSTAALLLALGTVASWYWAGLRVLDHEMTIGTVVAFVAISGQMYRPAFRLGQLQRQIAQALVSANDVFGLLDMGISKPERTPIPDIRASTRTPGIQPIIEFRNVTFGYGGQPPVLRNVSFNIYEGEFVALQGHSGQGKTTILSLLMNLYSPDDGIILVKGSNIVTLPREELASTLGYVPQHSPVVGGTIAENIALGVPTATEHDIVAAAKQACVHTFVMELPERYDTLLGVHGMTISGGQRQRLAIARAIIRRPEVLLIDEGTSSQDAGMEAELLGMFRQYARGKAVLFASHNSRIIEIADKILTLEQCMVREEVPRINQVP